MSSPEAEGASEHDPLEGLEARLQSHDQAFSSLLALTPARDYYGSQIVDGRRPDEQWNRKKATKEEKRAAKKAKLDPANQKSALDVMKEREERVKAKRKREEDGDSGKEDDRGQGKRQKREDDGDDEETKRREKAEKRKEKRLEKKEKSAKKKAKAEAKKARKQERDLMEAQDAKQSTGPAEGEVDDDSNDEAEPFAHPADMEDFDMAGLEGPEQAHDEEPDQDSSDGSSAPTTPIIDSPAFDVATNHSTASSSSSISAPSLTDLTALPETRRNPEPPSLAIDTTTANPPLKEPALKPTGIVSGTSSPKITLPHISKDELQARLEKKMAEMRAARKADGPDGKPIQSRQQLLEQRRKKGEQKKANKKAQRLKQKEEEAKKREEQLRGSGSPLSKVGDIFSPPPRENNYAFSRLAFGDGSAANADLSGLDATQQKKKGPSDPKTALLSAQARDAKLANLPAHKQSKFAENNMWSSASSRAAGERNRDDTSLLKKALKRKEKGKMKSEREWKEREEKVVKGREIGQKKREANLQKRREERGGKGKKKAGGGRGGPGGGKGGGKKKKGARPGFEGRFKA